MSESPIHNPFNSSIETGVRALAILEAFYPASLDLQRLVQLDYLIVHSGDAGGPRSLHAPLPLRAGELLVRRGLIENGLNLMMSRGLVVRLVSTTGIFYIASDAASPFLASLTASYNSELRERARWAAGRFREMPTEEIRGITRSFLKHWTSEFQPMKQLGLGI